MKKVSVFLVGIACSLFASGQQYYYPLDGNADDMSGNSKNGHVEGALPATDRFDKDAGAYHFNGRNDRIVMDDFQMPSTFTLSFWVKCDSLTGKRIMFSWNNFEVNTDDSYYGCSFGTSVEGPLVVNEIKQDPPEFDFIVVKYVSGRFTFYVNNAYVGTNWASPVFTVSPMILGGNEAGPFYGKLDDIRIYDRTLTSAEMDQLFFEGDYPSPLPVMKLESTRVISPVSAIVIYSLLYPGKSGVMEEGICWSTGSNPDTSESKILLNENNRYRTNIPGLNPATTYHIRSFAKNLEGIGYSNEIVITTLPAVSYGKMEDVEGNEYKTVRIGSDTWMAENLKTTHYNDGSEIPNVTDDQQWTQLNTGAYCWYKNDTANRTIYGALYNYYAAIDSRKLCPTNWHIPAKSEWDLLPTCESCQSFSMGREDYCKLKDPGDELWRFNPDGTNETGFSALPGGVRRGLDCVEKLPLGDFWALQFVGFFWDASGNDFSLVTNSWISDCEWNFSRTWKNGYSVRCIMDDPVAILPDQQVNQYSQVKIPVYIRNLPADEVISFQFKVAFDSLRMPFEKCETGGTLSEGGSIEVHQSGNRLSLAWANQTPLADTGKLIVLVFRAQAQDTLTPILSDFLLNTDTIKDIRNGRIEIIPAYGDIDANGIVQAYDAALALQFSTGLDPIQDLDSLPWINWRKKIADVDQDKIITAYDASLILRHTVSLIDSLPASRQLAEGNSQAHLSARLEDGYIVLQAESELHGLNINIKENTEILGEPEFVAGNLLHALNRDSVQYSLALASAYPVSLESILLKIPLKETLQEPILLDVLADKVKEQLVVSLPTATNDQWITNLEIYPSPVSEILYFKNLNGMASLIIYDMQGRIVKSSVICDQIDLSDLENGVYTIRLESQGKAVFRKIIKQ